MPPPPFPMQPLYDRLRASTNSELAVVIGVTRRSVLRARAAGGLTQRQADQWACSAGLHPAEVWGDLWWAA